ncbi:uncharacterized protein EI90DRAFT_3081815 [Cantharellus anzutake]|uniref:uncharacterized protein n=1 Tax=Cantharellus anzutake TaxID=1750568 RepID=UPI001904C3D3|nr:uncharacterized protein EI90DRAFT_3081815 [Cantharellus anzutake]KAF8319566.1 hypothetical protein EI90DRAFT_3081815 [Cantharellus anzutake]
MQATCAPVPLSVIYIKSKHRQLVQHIGDLFPVTAPPNPMPTPILAQWHVIAGWSPPLLDSSEASTPANDYSVPSDPQFFSPVAFFFFKNIPSYLMIFCLLRHDMHSRSAMSPHAFAMSWIEITLSWGPSRNWFGNLRVPRRRRRRDQLSLDWSHLAGLVEVGAVTNTSLQDSILRDANSVVGYVEDAVSRLIQAALALSTLIGG